MGAGVGTVRGWTPRGDVKVEGQGLSCRCDCFLLRTGRGRGGARLSRAGGMVSDIMTIMSRTALGCDTHSRPHYGPFS